MSSFFKDHHSQNQELKTFSIKLEDITNKVPEPYDNQEKDKLLTQLSDKLETLDPKSPMTMFMKAQVLEQLASVKKSNPILERAIHFYKEVLYR